jgi:Bacterial RNA polymerase, alpha chain C terminal domain
LTSCEDDDELTAYHEAGHAVTMWKLGLGLARVTIESTHGLRGSTKSVREYAFTAEDNVCIRRFAVEQNGVVLHAGGVAEHLLHPSTTCAQSEIDHQRVHTLMSVVEDDGSIQLAWCNYLWQRAHSFLAWPGQWYLVIGLARQLLEHRSLEGAAAERYLRIAADRVQYDPRMPNAILIGEITWACSRWHRTWSEKSWATPMKAKRTELPQTLIGLSAAGDMRRLAQVLTSLSARAHRCLARADIQTVIDLEDWNEWSLGSVKGIGKQTLREIMSAADHAGILRGAPARKLPWEVNPGRWRR